MNVVLVVLVVVYTKVFVCVFVPLAVKSILSEEDKELARYRTVTISPTNRLALTKSVLVLSAIVPTETRKEIMKHKRVVVANIAKIPNHLVVEVVLLSLLWLSIDLDVFVDNLRKKRSLVLVVSKFTAHWCPFGCRSIPTA